MIEKLNYTAEDGVLIEADVNGEHKEILFSDIEKYWDYATEDDFESGRVYVCDNQIVFTILVASGQGGVIVVWDTEKECVTHISEASYCQALYVHDDKIWYLCDVSNFVVPSHLQMYVIPLHTMDANDGGKRIYCQSPCQVYGKGCVYKSINVKVSDEAGILVKADTKIYRYSDTLDLNILSKRNEEFAWLYDVFKKDSSNHKSVEDSNSKNSGIDKIRVFGWLT